MKKKIRKILIFIFWIMLLSGLAYLFFRSQNKQKSRLCTALVINMNADSSKAFITPNEISQLIRDSVGILIDNKRLSDINLFRIRQLIIQNPVFENVSVFGTLNGEIIIDITQRKPIVRVFNTAGQNFYIDEKGIMFPVSHNYKEHLLIAGGNIREPYKVLFDISTDAASKANSALNKIFKIAAHITASTFWHAMISEIIIEENGDIELIPVTGGHRIVFGEAEDFEEKLDNLLFFYQEVMNQMNWEHFKIINIKYKDLIFCTE